MEQSGIGVNEIKIAHRPELRGLWRKITCTLG